MTTPLLSQLAGTRALLRLGIRRERVRITIWAIASAVFMGASASSVSSLYAHETQRLQYATMNRGNAALIVQSGPGYGLDHPTTGAIFMNEAALWAYVMVALMALTMTTRLTRLEEETCRAELARSAPVGRHAGSAAAALAVLVASATFAVATAAAVVVTGYAVTGAVVFAAALLLQGTTFAAITLVAAQCAATSRAATGLGLVAVGLAFVVRAFGDVRAQWVSWASPIHWAQAMRPYAGERWAVAIVPLTASAALVLLARRVADHRDFGQGMLQQRPGRAAATRHLVTPLGLAVRLHRGAVGGWAAGIASMGFFYGVVTDQAEKMVEDNPDMKDFLAAAGVGSITDAFLAMGVLVMGLMAGGFIVSAALRLRAEEHAGRADEVLATKVTRSRWALSHLTVALVGLVGLMAVGGLAQGLGAAVTMGDSSQIGRNLVAGLVMAAGVAVLGAVAFLLCAAAPRWALLSWAGLVLTAAMSILAQVLDLPMWLRDVSPFQHVPAMPAASFHLLPLVVLGAVAAALIAAGFVALDRRDVGRA